MSKGPNRIGAAVMVVLSGGLLLAGAAAAQTAKPAHQQAAKAEAAPETPLCALVKKVVAAAPGEFNSLKGVQDTTLPVEPGKTPVVFKGTLNADAAATDCTLYIRRGSNMEIPPLYSCQLGPLRTLADSKPVYEKAAAELRACFPKGTFEEKREGDESKREEGWTLKLEQPGVEVSLGLGDIGLTVDLINRTTSDKPGVQVELQVTDTRPAAEAPKTAAAQEMSAAIPICRFVEKVMAASATEYAGIRSPRPVAGTQQYVGTLKPNALSSCKVLPPSSGTHMSYVCEVGRAKTMAEIKSQYVRLKTELPACYSNFTFKEEIMKNDSGEPDTRDEMWFFTGKDPRYEITLTAEDDGWRLKAEPDKVDAQTRATPVSLHLQVRSLQP